MIIKLLKYLFNNVIGRLPEAEREKYREQFNELLECIIRAAAEGAVRGAKK